MSNDLPEDVIVEIFSRLPTKSLLRFRSVSKSLHACIGSPSFIRLHALRSPVKVTVIHRTKGAKGKPYPKYVYTLLSEAQLSYNPYIGIKPLDYPFKSFRIVGLCNGIICVYECGKGINLWNPSIRRKVTITDLPSYGDRLVHGFGFNPFIDDYKILRISGSRSFVYTTKTSAWREIASPSTPFGDVKPHSCLFNGVLHWVVNSTNSLGRFYRSYIMTFDLSSEVFSTVSLPQPKLETNEVTFIKGCLAVISLKDEHSCIWGIGAYDLEKLMLRRVKILSGSSCAVDMSMCVESLGLLDMGTSCDQGSKSQEKKKKGEA
ncbi:hypothetical protein L1987_63890 [Smallanthus sonchifolius]|uniref:Uncharacterized protein n=1 Tax=Smallanthus sonchifolius TaxID=185202 RepID=A0ACB9CEF8_9ASTR|nr:hypothetical protein L1987_63890 [Smallanthus sonchifolius]